MMVERWVELARERLRRAVSTDDLRNHLREAVGWLYRAQDSSADRGVAHSYVVGKGWTPSYPETTGYIIPTLLRWWQRSGDDEARRRALEMADWEIAVQHPRGGIPSLTTGKPVVFDTAQVIFGWITAFAATQDSRYLDAATRAARWLLEAAREGSWRRQSDGATYNVRSAWALLELGRLTADPDFARRLRPFLDWCLAQETGRGWFRNNCLNDDERPLVHTIAYTAEGLFECGLLLEDQRLVDAARRTAIEVSRHVAADGRLPGRFDRRWAPAASWACLTGMAQMSVVWRRFHRLDRDDAMATAASLVNSFLLATHDVESRSGDLRGGIRGSYPLNGAYCRYRVINWGTKFFVDALLEAELPPNGFAG